MSVAIVGAGIGGLTTALFLEKLGVSVQVFEQSPEIKPIGAGIILAHNAMQVFDKLGFKESLTDLGNPLTSINIATEKLEVLNRIETLHFDRKYGANSVAIQRGILQRFLIDKLQTKCLNLNKKVVDFKTGERNTIVFSDGDKSVFDVVIAADGIQSMIRKKTFDRSVIRSPNQVCWRGISNAKLPMQFDTELNELWGKGSRFGFVNISKNEVYWYALHNGHDQIEKSDLLAYFQDYDPVVNSVISATKADKIFKSDIYDLKPISSWFKGNVCLLGDAAHATTPNMGQGECQAIEDAYVLSHYISQYDAAVAFSKYQGVRKAKADMIVNLSWKFGMMSQIQNPIARALRNLSMKAIPAKYNVKQSDKIYQLAEL
ncbi:FAD-dependent monooxygenase [Marinomonas mediterranea]|uniref:FAD-dependent monooxygenase n=1 Tax=Marinomonas mediterranea TaxID=119864 RepID=UPI00234B7ED0|nr:FAD-dependent monooxygenase [Marinomonas mediterranea]WCN09609.1 NAD(P)-binding protein [Marinomonas mediterranea]